MLPQAWRLRRVDKLGSLLYVALILFLALGAPAQAMEPRPSAVQGWVETTDALFPQLSSAWLPSLDERERYWASPDRRFIYISQDQQMMYVFLDGEVIRYMPCTTGLPQPGTATPSWSGRVGDFVGTFESFGVMADEGWFLFWDEGGILIHSAPYKLVNGKKVYEEMDLLGKRPASHGCIRISPDDARWLSEWNPKGALAMITPLTRSFPAK